MSVSELHIIVTCLYTLCACMLPFTTIPFLAWSKFIYRSSQEACRASASAIPPGHPHSQSHQHQHPRRPGPIPAPSKGRQGHTHHPFPTSRQTLFPERRTSTPKNTCGNSPISLSRDASHGNASWRHLHTLPRESGPGAVLSLPPEGSTQRAGVVRVWEEAQRTGAGSAVAAVSAHEGHGGYTTRSGN